MRLKSTMFLVMVSLEILNQLNRGNLTLMIVSEVENGEMTKMERDH